MNASIKRLTEWCGTDENGTTEFGVMAGLRALGMDYEECNVDNVNHALGFVIRRHVVLLCIDDWGHWVVVTEICPGRYLLIDSENSPANRAENGCRAISERTLLTRWRASARVQTDKHDRTYYGLAVFRHPTMG